MAKDTAIIISANGDSRVEMADENDESSFPSNTDKTVREGTVEVDFYADGPIPAEKSERIINALRERMGSRLSVGPIGKMPNTSESMGPSTSGSADSRRLLGPDRPRQRRSIIKKRQVEPEPVAHNRFEPFVDIDTVRSLLGNIPKSSLYKWMSQRGFPYYKLGRHARFRLSEIDAWIRKYCGDARCRG
ncbi:MAG: helix-turn-helix domain-containing protein [Chitinivibrionales bacterium]|nr:helix-turn-helix domain-containing protein [Chitinivibrionales bacterium]